MSEENVSEEKAKASEAKPLKDDDLQEVVGGVLPPGGADGIQPGSPLDEDVHGFRRYRRGG